MGYSENAKAYRIYIPESRKIVVRRDMKFMEERAFKKTWEMSSATQSKEDSLVQPQRPMEDGSSASPRHKDPKDSFSKEVQEGEQVDPPTTSGRTSRELQQTLRDAEEFVGAPRNEKRQGRQPDRYQALVAQVGKPSTFQEASGVGKRDGGGVQLHHDK